MAAKAMALIRCHRQKQRAEDVVLPAGSRSHLWLEGKAGAGWGNRRASCSSNS